MFKFEDKDKEKLLDQHERKMAQYTVEDIWNMTDEEVLSCANIKGEGDIVGITLNGTYFDSQEEASEVARAVVQRVRQITEDNNHLKKRFESESKPSKRNWTQWFDDNATWIYFGILFLIIFIPLTWNHLISEDESGDPADSVNIRTFERSGSDIFSRKESDEYKYEYRTGYSAPYTYNYDVSGYGDLGYVYGNVDIKDKYGEGYIYTENGDELWVEVEWVDYGVMEAYDEDGNWHELEVD